MIVEHERTTFNSIAFSFFCLGILTEPIYVLPSGLPQPGDIFYVLALLFGSAALVNGINDSTRLFAGTLYVFNLWVFSVSAFWIVILSDFDPFHFIYMLFNSLLCLFVISQGEDKRAYPMLLAMTTASLVGQVIYLLLDGGVDPSVRHTGTTNNPNQLAFWALNAAVIAVMCAKESRLLYMAGINIAAAAVVIYFTLSKGGAMALSTLVVLLPIISVRLFGLVSVAAGVLLFVAHPSFDAWRSRLDTQEDRGPITSVGELLAYRGYDRIYDFPQYLLGGASELQPLRFGGVENELHSTIANLLFSYGIIGVGLFSLLMWLSIRRSWISKLPYFVPPLVFGLSHNGLRSTLFWVIIGLLVAAKSPQERNIPAYVGNLAIRK